MTGRAQTILAAAILFVSGAAAYFSSLHGAFVFDDKPAIAENAAIRRLWPLGPIFHGPRPVVDLTFAVNYAIGRLHVEGYHLVNLAVHLLAALALFGIVRRTLTLPVFAGRFDRDRRRAARVLRRADLDGPSASDRSGHLSHPARRIAHGTVLSADALLRDPRLLLGEPSWSLVCRRGRRLRAGNGLQAGHGHRAADRAALRPLLHRRLVRRGVPSAMGALSRAGGDLADPGSLVRRGGRPACELGRVPVSGGDAVPICAERAGRDSPLPRADVLAGAAVPGLRLAGGQRV